jgi:tetratricopeptide (TPR) repeat protein
MSTFEHQQQTNNLSAMEDTAKQHFIIGENLRFKAFYEDAVDEFQKALHIQEPLLGDTSVVLAKTHYSMGLAMRATKDYGQALYHLNRANAIYIGQPIEIENKKEFEEEMMDCKLNMARTHHSQGVDFQRSGDYDRSIAEHRKALLIREHILGRSHLETARSYYVIGCALSDRGNFDEALAELGLCSWPRAVLSRQ